MTLAEGRREDAARHAEVAPKSQGRLAKGDVGSSPYSLGAALGALGIWAMRLTEEGQEDAAPSTALKTAGPAGVGGGFGAGVIGEL